MWVRIPPPALVGICAVRTAEEVAKVLALRAENVSALRIAMMTGVPRSTVRDWLAGRLPRSAQSRAVGCVECQGAHHALDELPGSYVYLLGLYLGDGCISTHPRRVYRLRIMLDLKYPGIIDECEAAIRELVPENRVSRMLRRSNYTKRSEYVLVEVAAYSKAWLCLFPQHGPGRKHHRHIRLSHWQERVVDRYPERLLRGLIHSDGCRFINTGRSWRHPRYSFSNRSEDILRIFCDACDRLGVRWTTAPHTIYVSRRADVARLDRWIGPKA